MKLLLLLSPRFRLHDALQRMDTVIDEIAWTIALFNLIGGALFSVVFLTLRRRSGE